MLGRKKAFFATVIILAIFYLYYLESTRESIVLFSKKIAQSQLSEVDLSSVKPQITKVQSAIMNQEADDELSIFTCVPELFVDEDVYLDNITQYLQSLAGAASAEESLYYALFALPPEGESKLDLLFNYFTNVPENQLIAMRLISSCVNTEDARCNPDSVSNAINADPNNGAIWLNAIAYFAAIEDDSGVVDAIEALMKTAFFNERYGEQTLLYTQALAGSNANKFTLNAIAGLAESAANHLAYAPITQWCQQNIDDPNKANACLMLGEQLETRSQTIINKAIGIALQGMVFKSQENSEAVQLTEINRAALTSSTANEQYQKASMMLMLDEELLRNWLTNIDQYGEVNSQQLLVEEAQTRYADNENYLCSLAYDLLDN